MFNILLTYFLYFLLVTLIDCDTRIGEFLRLCRIIIGLLCCLVVGLTEINNTTISLNVP